MDWVRHRLSVGQPRNQSGTVPGPTLSTTDGAPARSDIAPERATVTEADHRGGEEPPTRWLTAAEVGSWLSVVRFMTWLPWSIDQQLRRDANIGMVEYQVLAMLSQSPQRAMRMSSLADVTNSSLSRLSHLVTRLEGRGLVRREPDPADGRFTNAILTERWLQGPRRRRAGARGSCASARHRRAVARAAPAPGLRCRPDHVAHRDRWNQLAPPALLSRHASLRSRHRH